MTGGVEVVGECVQDGASRHPLFLRPTMQIVVRKVCHSSVAVCATGYVSCRIVTKRFHFAERVCFAGDTIQAVVRPARDVVVKVTGTVVPLLG